MIRAFEQVTILWVTANLSLRCIRTVNDPLEVPTVKSPFSKIDPTAAITSLPSFGGK